jgi:hypothetical protein
LLHWRVKRRKTYHLIQNDPWTRVNVKGFIIYLLDLPICWRSKSLKRETRSSTEAKYVAIFEDVMGHNFVYYFLCDLQTKVNLPIVVKTKSFGAIFMSENALAGFRTSYMNTRYHFDREFIEEGSYRLNSFPIS